MIVVHVQAEGRGHDDDAVRREEFTGPREELARVGLVLEDLAEQDGVELGVEVQVEDVFADEAHPIPHCRRFFGELGRRKIDGRLLDVDADDGEALSRGEDARNPLAAADVQDSFATELGAHPVDAVTAFTLGLG